MTPRTAPLVRVLIAAADRGRAVLSTALSRAGFEVTAIEEEVPAIARADSAAFEIVIVDLHRRTGGLAMIPHDK